MKHKEKEEESKKKTPLKDGWKWVDTNKQMLKLKRKREYGAMAHAATIFDEKNSELDV